MATMAANGGENFQTDPSMPDLSHLSAEERAIIEQVLQRQRAEEQKEEEIAQVASKELEEIERQIAERKENAQRLLGTQDDAICQICQKTKFADGIGHKCFYCQLRSCARCGGRTTSKNKTIWACSMCQKRQQILARTGKWFQHPSDPSSQTNSGNAPQSEDPVSSESSHNLDASTSVAITHHSEINANHQQGENNHRIQIQDRDHDSAIVKFQPTLTKQSSMEVSRRRSSNKPHEVLITNGVKAITNNDEQEQEKRKKQPQYNNQELQLLQNAKISRNDIPSKYDEATTTKKIDEIEATKRQNSRRFRNTDIDIKQTGNNQSELYNLKNANGPISSDETKRNDEPSSSNHKKERNIQVETGALPRRVRDKNNRYGVTPSSSQNENLPYLSDLPSSGRDRVSNRNTENISQRRATGISNTVQKFSPNTARSSRRIKLPRQLRSLSSSEEEELTGVISSQTTSGIRKEKQHKNNRQQYIYENEQTHLPLSSSLQNTAVRDSDFSEKDLLRYIYGPQKLSKTNKSASLSRFDVSNTTQSISKAHHNDSTRARCVAGNLLASKIRRYLSYPISWQPSADQRRLIGHMILTKTFDGDSSEDFGLKLVGGRYSQCGATLGTFIVQVKPGSIADTVGRLRPGDEVLEWNSHVMQNLNHEAVCKIVSASRNDTKLELIVSRPANMPGSDDFLNMGERTITNMRYEKTYGAGLETLYRIYDAPNSVQSYSPLTAPYQLPRIPYAQLSHSQSLSGAPLINRHFSASLPPPQQHERRALSQHQNPGNLYNVGESSPLIVYRDIGQNYDYYYPHNTPQGVRVCGKIEISLLYSCTDRQLTVTLHRAFNLMPRANETARNPYVKIFLLPDRSERSRRESGALANTLAPVWNEQFVYNELSEQLLTTRVLEVTVWDYDKYEANTFLGEVLIDLSEAVLDDRPFIYSLIDADDENPIRLRLRHRKYSSQTSPIRSRSHIGHYTNSEASLYGWNSQDCSNSLQNLPFHPIKNDNGAKVNDNRELRTRDTVAVRHNGGNTSYPTFPQQDISTAAEFVSSYEQDWNRNNAVGYLSDYSDRNCTSLYSEDLRRLHRRPRSAIALRNLSKLEGNTIYNPLNEQLAYYVPYENQDGPIYAGGAIRRREVELIQQEQHTGGYGSDGSEGTLSVNSAQSMQNRSNLRSQHQKQQLSQARLQQQLAYYNDSSFPDTLQQQQPPYYIENSVENNVSNNNNSSNRNEYGISGEYGIATSFDDVPEGSANPNTSNNGSADSCTDFLLNNNSSNDSNGSGVVGSTTGVMPFMASGKSATMLLAKRKKSLMTRFIPGRNGPTDGKRMGFARSEEVGVSEALSVPDQLNVGGGDTNLANNITKQPSKESTDSSDNWLPINVDKPLGSFVENLGPGQVVGRQCVASPMLGELELLISFDSTANEIILDVLRARNLVWKPGAKTAPAPYVKAYLMEGKNCIAKAKTQPARKSSAPVINQRLAFPANPRGKMLQVTVFGDYGRMERKSFMGIAQVNLDELDLQGPQIIGWYKLFHSNSLVTGGAPISSASVIRKDSENSMKYQPNQHQ